MHWVTIIWVMVATASAVLALVHGFYWTRQRDSWSSLFFSFMASGTAAMAAVELLMMRAETPAAFGTILRWYHIPIWISFSSLVGFVHLQLGGRPWLAWAARLAKALQAKELELRASEERFNLAAEAAGAGFLAALNREKYDCLLLDLHMPEITGFDLLTSLAVRPDRPPVIVITGHDEPGNSGHVRDLSAAEYLVKPVEEIDLLEAMQRCMEPAPRAAGSLDSGSTRRQQPC